MSQPSDYPPPPPGAPPPPGSPPTGASYPPGPPATAALPWEEREQRGFAEAFIETVKLIVTAPQDAFSRLRKDGDLVSPIIFGMIISWVPAVIAQLWQAVMTSVLPFGGLGAEMGAGMASGFAGLMMTLILWPIIFAVSMMFGTLIYHGSLMLLGGLKNPGMGWEGTLKVLCYAQVSALGNIVPVVGIFISLAALLYFMFIGFQSVHRATPGQALGASLIPMALCCVCIITVVVMSGVGIAALAAGAG